MKTCPNCKVAVSSEQVRCGNCGQALTPTHVSARKTEPVRSPPPTYIPPPSPHPAAQSRRAALSLRLPRRPTLLIAGGAVALAIIVIAVFLLNRPPQLAGEWYGTLASQGSGATIYAEVYLDLSVGQGNAITGTGEFCAARGNPSVAAGRHSPFTVTGQISGTQVTLALDANRFGGTPGATSYLGTLTGQGLSLQLQAGSTTSIGMTLQPGTRGAYAAACAA